MNTLAKAMMFEEVAPPEAVAQALFVAVTRGVPLVRAFADTGAVSADALGRYLARADVPFLRQVVPVPELVDALPEGLCARLLAVPVRRDPRTGTVDIVVADPGDPHPAQEIAFHLAAPVRVVRAHAAAIEDALARHRSRSVPPPSATEHGTRGRLDQERAYDSRRPAAPNASKVQDAPHARQRNTPPWGTPFHSALAGSVVSEPPRSGLGSEIPIPLTRKTFAATAGGTQRPPPLPEPAVVAGFSGSPPLSAAPSEPTSSLGEYAAFAPHLTFADVSTITAALRSAGSRDEVLELLLTGARTLAFRVAVFVVKRGDYMGWACSPEFGERRALQSLAIPMNTGTIFDRAVLDGLYLGSIPYDDRHAGLLGTMRSASRDVAVVPVRVSGKAAVILFADELGDTMTSTRRLEELARAAGDAFAQILRMRR